MQDSTKKVSLYDTTLRDGTQQQGISLSVEDKLQCVSVLDAFGFDYIEGGWPGSNPKDEEFFKRVLDLELRGAKLAAFGSTRRKDTAVESDSQVEALIAANTPVVTLVGKSSVLHVKELLKTTLEENLAMISDTVKYCVSLGKEVIFDAEHFFDGYELDSEYALCCLQAAADAGASTVVLCDTNGGALPSKLAAVVASIVEEVTCSVGIHTHNDAGCAVANSIIAVTAGARQVQGTVNGYGERCGNANLISVIPALFYKQDYQANPRLDLTKLTLTSRVVAEIVNENHEARQPYTGISAFAHKGGLHVAAVEKFPESYEHLNPELLGNSRQIVVSELSGRGTMRMIAKDTGLHLDCNEQTVLELIKQREHQGYAYESAEGSAELLMRKSMSGYEEAFSLIEMSVVSRSTGSSGDLVQAAVKLQVGDQQLHTVADGSGPVHALDLALRKALVPVYPELSNVKLSNYKVRILNPDSATEAKTRVMVEARDEHSSWITLGCSENIILASIEALIDSYELYLARNSQRDFSPRSKAVGE